LVVNGHPSPAGPPEGQPVVTVTTAKPERNTVRRIFELPGQIEASEQTGLYAQIAGSVQTVHVDIGDRVKKGQVLATLAVPEIQAERKQKLALVAQVEAEVERARRAVQAAEAAFTLLTAQVQEAEAGLKRAQATYDYRKIEYDRFEKLVQAKAIDPQLLEEKRNQLEATKAALAEATAKVKAATAAREGGAARREEAGAEVKVAMARLQVAKADVERVEVLLQFAKVCAPFDGVVTRRSVDTGAFTGPVGGKAGPLLVVARIDSVRFVVALPETAIPFVATGTRAILRVPAFEGREFEGKVTRTAGALDPKTRTLRAEIDLPNPKAKLLPGLYATATLTVERAGVWTLPSAAVVTQGGQTVCYRVEGGKAIRTPVRVGLRADGLVEVLQKQGKPVKPGAEGTWEDFTGAEVIVTSDPGKLTDGQPVRFSKRNFWIDPISHNQYSVGVRYPEKDLKALSKARLDAAEKAYTLAMKSFAQLGQGSDPEYFYRWSRRWLSAQREMSTKKEDQVAALEAHLKRMQDLQKRVITMNKVGQGPVRDVAAAEFYQAEAELWLAREKAK
jgi:RND family efflux transporter MFP subunit